MSIIEYEEIRLLKQSEKSTVLLVREKDGEQLFIRKILQGRHDIYEILRNCSHPYLPKVYEVSFSDDATSVIEEYIEGKTLGAAELTEKSICTAIKELCSVLQFLHEKSIIHRDIKPSNIILANDGHIRLIDFDAARMNKDNMEQDTRLLGTRGYAPPEQYGFAQTDTRADIYSLGITLKQLLGEKAKKLRYKRIIKKCTDLNPDKRYRSAKQVEKALAFRYRGIAYISMVIAILVVSGSMLYSQLQPETPIEAGQAQVEEDAIQKDRIVLTDIIKSPFNTIDTSPVHIIGGEWEIDDPSSGADATLYKDDRAIAKVLLFEDEKSDIQSREFKTWSAPASSSGYFQLSEYLELDMSTDEVIAALDKAKYHSTLEYPRIYVDQATSDLGEEYDVIHLHYNDYVIDYYLFSEMPIVEIRVRPLDPIIGKE